MIVYGLVAYLSLIALTVGYFFIKKYGDSKEGAPPELKEEYGDFEEEGE